MAIDIVTVARGWIGTPYRHQASCKGAGCDCLGLLRGVWRELRGAEPEDIPPYTPDWAEARGAETLRDALARHLTPVTTDAIAPGDVALFRMTRFVSGRAPACGTPAKHCGIVASRGAARTLIHACQNRAVREEIFSSFWRVRLAFAFRM